MSVVTRLLSGEATIGVALDGEERQRLTLIDDEAGLDLVRNGDTAWAYSAADDTAVRFSLDARRPSVHKVRPVSRCGARGGGHRAQGKADGREPP